MKQHPLALFLFLFALYLLTYSPTLHSSDGLAMFSTAESLARRGAWDVEQIRWMGLQQGTYGLDGRLYSRKGVGQPLLALPFTWLGLVIPWFGTVTTTLLFGNLVTALTGALIFCYLEWLGYRRATALTAGLVYGTGTLAWPYAKTFFSDTLAGTLLLLAAMFLLAHYRRGRRRDAFAAGLALAWAVATRYAEAVFLPLFGLLFAAYLRRRSGGGGPRRAFNPAALAAFAAPIAAVGLSLMAFNLFRYGDPFNTGYLPQETFSAVWWQGVAGQLFSPGRGVFLYSPALIVALFGLKAGWRRRPFETFTALAVIVIHLLLYGKWFMWHGGFAWGPRFMVAALPFWAVLMAPTLEAIAARSVSPLIRRGFFVLWGVSVAAQLPGLAVDFDLWQNRLLQTGLPLFAPETFFRPVYSPLLGTWQFINPANLDLAWAAGGKINWILLAALAANLALAGVALAAAGRKRPARMWLPVAAAAAIATVIFLLTAAHRAQPVPLTRALAEVNRLPDAPLIYNTPEQAIPLAELYAGRAPMLGLIEADAAPLARIAAQATAVWWLPAQGESDIEAALLNTFGPARDDTLDGQRLVLLARPDGPPRRVNLRLGSDIRLQSARLSRRLQPNHPFAVTLVWRAERPPPDDYHVFVHLLNAQGEIAAQSDGRPVHWTRPTSGWRPAETITDRRALWIPALPPGPYTLIAGLYLPATGRRLPAESGAGFIQLAEFQIQ